MWSKLWIKLCSLVVIEQIMSPFLSFSLILSRKQGCGAGAPISGSESGSSSKDLKFLALPLAPKPKSFWLQLQTDLVHWNRRPLYSLYKSLAPQNRDVELEPKFQALALASAPSFKSIGLWLQPSEITRVPGSGSTVLAVGATTLEVVSVTCSSVLVSYTSLHLAFMTKCFVTGARGRNRSLKQLYRLCIQTSTVFSKPNKRYSYISKIIELKYKKSRHTFLIKRIQYECAVFLGFDLDN